MPPNDSVTALDHLPLHQDTDRAIQVLAHSSPQQAADLKNKIRSAVDPQSNGNLSGWIDAWQQLPESTHCRLDAAGGCVTLSGHLTESAAPSSATPALKETLLRFHPWRKGPFRVFDQSIDTEWRSDWKWDRLADAVEFRNRTVLDVGCGNGYFGWRMLDAGARCVTGIDPFLLFVMQHQVMRKYVPDPPNFVLPLTDDDLRGLAPAFDVTLSMGVLYHRVSPIEHLQTLHQSLHPGGQVVLETLVLDRSDESVLVPERRYAKMRNVWFIPTPSMLTRWMQRVGFRDIHVVDITPTTTSEQRSTDWMTFESLPDFLDPDDASKTIEGYPAPVRAIVTATQ